MTDQKNTCHRYGVAGVGGENPKLERLWDAEGKIAVPGTDQREGYSDFDGCAPFMRRKCVGTWELSEDKSRAEFHVAAYLGEPGYTEDGSMGDYVAVEIKPLLWYHDEKKGILGVSADCHEEGWEYHPVCMDREGKVRPLTYLPAYELALDENGRAVSLPGYHPLFGTYYGLREAARGYQGGAVADYAILETTAIWHYNYLLMLIEYATQNTQEVIYGACSMRYKPDVIEAVPAANSLVVSAQAGDVFVLGQTILTCAYFKDHPKDTSSYNIITGITPCLQDGTPDEGGEYRLISYDGEDRSGQITVGVTQVASRPWITGVCTGSSPYVAPVLGHTGSPVSNENGIYPMLYRHMENVFSNINKNCVDLMNERLCDENGRDYLEWYFLPDPSSYMPAGEDYPDPEDLHRYWVKLGVRTENDSYVNGYIKSFEYDERFPYVQIPTSTVGGSENSYYCDWADVVLEHKVRSIRRGGSMYSFGHYGPCFMSANGAVSHGGWYYGARLCMLQ